MKLQEPGSQHLCGTLLKLQPSFRAPHRSPGPDCTAAHLLPLPRSISGFPFTGVNPDHANLLASQATPPATRPALEGKVRGQPIIKILSAGYLVNLLPLSRTTLSSPSYTWGQKDDINCSRLYSQPSLVPTHISDK